MCKQSVCSADFFIYVDKFCAVEARRYIESVQRFGSTMRIVTTCGNLAYSSMTTSGSSSVECKAACVMVF